MSTLHFRVIGMPAPQGSKKFVGHSKAGRAIMVESSKAVKPWREAVSNAARDAIASSGGEVFDGPLRLAITFHLPRPQSLSRSKLAMGPCRKPDLSKLVRSSEDALVDAGAIADDARIVECVARKVFVEPGGHLGAEISIEQALPGIETTSTLTRGARPQTSALFPPTADSMGSPMGRRG